MRLLRPRVELGLKPPPSADGLTMTDLGDYVSLFNAFVLMVKIFQPVIPALGLESRKRG
jgi:hypothetical protein